MDLNTLWFILIAVLFCGFFFLEGFDYGVGVLLPFLGKNDTERRIIINTIGPVWDANEVWLITAGGAMFAAFPNWYATLFSGFYLPLLLILGALIFRGVGIEFRSKVENKTWKGMWDAALFISNFIPALLWGVAFSNLIKGVPIDSHMEYTGGFFNLLTPYTLLAGISGFAFFVYHGAVYISLRTKGELMERALKTARSVGAISLVLWAAVGVYTYFETEVFTKPLAVLLLAISYVSGVVALYLIYTRKNIKAMLGNGVAAVAAIGALFAGLFPRVMVSSTSKAFDLTITNASSSPYTLKIMSIIALTLVPIVLLYQGWSYWVFRKRVTSKDIKY